MRTNKRQLTDSTPASPSKRIRGENAEKNKQIEEAIRTNFTQGEVQLLDSVHMKNRERFIAHMTGFLCPIITYAAGFALEKQWLPLEPAYQADSDSFHLHDWLRSLKGGNLKSDFFQHLSDTLMQKAREEGPRMWIEFLDHEPFLLEQQADSKERLVEMTESNAATEGSWRIGFRGQGAQALFGALCQKFKLKDSYARYLPIVQSSGMGKSRLVHEFSLSHFVVPMCLRVAGAHGFPPADENLCNFFTEETNLKKWHGLANAFLIALSDEVLAWLDRHYPPGRHCEMFELAESFRKYMTDGMSTTEHNRNRKNFYDNVIKQAKTYFVQIERSGIPSSSIGPSMSTSSSGSSIPQQDNSSDAAREPTENIAPAHSHSNIRSISSPSPQVTVRAEQGIQTNCSASWKRVIAAISRIIETQEPSMSPDEIPFIILCFDEAKILTERLGRASKGGTLSRFTEIRRALRSMRGESVFALFLSTTGKVYQFGGPVDSSNRVQDGQLFLLSPFCKTGFGMFAQQIVPERDTLDTLTSLGHIVSLGRPLFHTRYQSGEDSVKKYIIRFAAEKLLCQDPGALMRAADTISPAQALACLSVRLALDFQPNYTFLDDQLTQIENYMRVCLKVGDDFNTVTSISASEPLLAEAAAGVMASQMFNPVAQLLSEFRRPAIERGPRGELVVALMLLLTRDKLVFNDGQDLITDDDAYFLDNENRAMPLVAFMREFFGKEQGSLVESAGASCAHPFPTDQPSLYHEHGGESSSCSQASFARMFAKSRCYFNHFVKFRSIKTVTRKHLLRCASRGAAILCANGMKGIDLIIPFFFDGNTLDVRNVSAILWQCENDTKYTSLSKAALFDAIDPYDLEIIDPNSEHSNPSSHLLPPIIRVVSSLAATEPCLTNWQERRHCKHGSFLSYDFWAAGFEDAIYRALSYRLVNKGETSETFHEWKTLLDPSINDAEVFSATDTDTSLVAHHQSQYPCGYDSSGHWSFWSLDAHDTISG